MTLQSPPPAAPLVLAGDLAMPGNDLVEIWLKPRPADELRRIVMRLNERDGRGEERRAA